MILTEQNMAEKQYGFDGNVIHYPMDGCTMIDGSSCWVLKEVDALWVSGSQYRLYAYVSDSHVDLAVMRHGGDSLADEFVDKLPICWDHGYVRWDISKARRMYEDILRKFDRNTMATALFNATK